MNKEGFSWLAHYQAGVKSSVEYPEVSLSEILENSTAKYPENIALVFHGIKLTYSTLLNMVNRLATGLNGLGVSKGDRVAIMLPNCPQWVMSYFAVLKLGAIVVQTNPMYVERELEHLLKDSGAETIVVLDSFLPRVKNIREASGLKRVICVSFEAPVEEENIFSFELMLKTNPANPPEVKINPKEDIALLQYTGGTTGTAKGVMLTHYNLVVNVCQVANWLPDCKEGQERFLTVLPLFHVYSMTLNNNLSVYLAGTQYLLPKFDTDSLLKVIHEFRPTIFPGAPTLYVAIINHPEISKYNLRSIRACISGSAPLPVEVAEKFHRMTGGLVVEGYGLSEASPVTHVNPFGGGARYGSIGLPVSDTIAKIVDIETGDIQLPIGEAGELVVHGPQVMSGYWNMPSDTTSTLRNGWLFTGDIAKMDQDGYFYIVDRKKDTIIAGGFNIYPREVEEVLYTHPKIKEAVVIGVPDPYRGETVKAFVVLREGEIADSSEITAYCREQMAAYKVPQYIEFRESLPKTAVGKILRRALKTIEREQEIG